MRIFTATLGTESNTFAPVATCLDDYRDMVLLRPGEHPDDTPLMCTAQLFAARRRGARDGFTLIEGSCFAASPGCHLTRKRVRLSDIIVLYKEYPHTDTVQRADDLIGILLATLRGDVHPVMAVYDCRQIGNYPTTHPEMRKFVDWAASLERGPILSVSIGHCYPYADVPEMSGRILVVADSDQQEADRVATEVGEAFIALRGRTTHRFLDVDPAIDAALELPHGPVVITDAADNAGGGAPSDNTTILRRLLERGIGDVALGPLWDPMAVRNCFAAGLGAVFALRFGGKTGVTSGAPIDAAVEVIGLARNASQSYGPSDSFLGDMAAVRINGVEVVLNTVRTQAFGPELLR